MKEKPTQRGKTLPKNNGILVKLEYEKGFLKFTVYIPGF